jgi:quinol-cytochrome oxidoreductase complex cytochrome b subunit
LFDRNPERHPRRRKIAAWLGIMIIASGLGLGILGHLADTTHEIFGKKVYFDIKGMPKIMEEVKPSP